MVEAGDAAAANLRMRAELAVTRGRLVEVARQRAAAEAEAEARASALGSEAAEARGEAAALLAALVATKEEAADLEAEREKEAAIADEVAAARTEFAARRSEIEEFRQRLAAGRVGVCGGSANSSAVPAEAERQKAAHQARALRAELQDARRQAEAMKMATNARHTQCELLEAELDAIRRQEGSAPSSASGDCSTRPARINGSTEIPSVVHGSLSVELAADVFLGQARSSCGTSDENTAIEKTFLSTSTQQPAPATPPSGTRRTTPRTPDDSCQTGSPWMLRESARGSAASPRLEPIRRRDDDGELSMSAFAPTLEFSTASSQSWISAYSAVRHVGRMPLLPGVEQAETSGADVAASSKAKIREEKGVSLDLDLGAMLESGWRQDQHKKHNVASPERYRYQPDVVCGSLLSNASIECSSPLKSSSSCGSNCGCHTRLDCTSKLGAVDTSMKTSVDEVTMTMDSLGGSGTPTVCEYCAGLPASRRRQCRHRCGRALGLHLGAFVQTDGSRGSGSDSSCNRRVLDGGHEGRPQIPGVTTVMSMSESSEARGDGNDAFAAAGLEAEPAQASGRSEFTGSAGYFRDEPLPQAGLGSDVDLGHDARGHAARSNVDLARSLKGRRREQYVRRPFRGVWKLGVKDMRQRRRNARSAFICRDVSAREHADLAETVALLSAELAEERVQAEHTRSARSELQAVTARCFELTAEVHAERTERASADELKAALIAMHGQCSELTDEAHQAHAANVSVTELKAEVRALTHQCSALKMRAEEEGRASEDAVELNAHISALTHRCSILKTESQDARQATAESKELKAELEGAKCLWKTELQEARSDSCRADERESLFSRTLEEEVAKAVAESLEEASRAAQASQALRGATGEVASLKAELATISQEAVDARHARESSDSAWEEIVCLRTELKRVGREASRAARAQESCRNAHEELAALRDELVAERSSRQKAARVEREELHKSERKAQRLNAEYESLAESEHVCMQRNRCLEDELTACRLSSRLQLRRRAPVEAAPASDSPSDEDSDVSQRVTESDHGEHSARFRNDEARQNYSADGAAPHRCGGDWSGSAPDVPAATNRVGGEQSNRARDRSADRGRVGCSPGDSADDDRRLLQMGRRSPSRDSVDRAVADAAAARRRRILFGTPPRLAAKIAAADEGLSQPRPGDDDSAGPDSSTRLPSSPCRRATPPRAAGAAEAWGGISSLDSCELPGTTASRTTAATARSVERCGPTPNRFQCADDDEVEVGPWAAAATAPPTALASVASAVAAALRRGRRSRQASPAPRLSATPSGPCSGPRASVAAPAMSRSGRREESQSDSSLERLVMEGNPLFPRWRPTQSVLRPWH